MEHKIHFSTPPQQTLKAEMAKSFCILFLLACFVVNAVNGSPVFIVGPNQYDEALARQMLAMSAAAYSSSPQNCFNQTFPQDENWQDKSDITSNCDFLQDSCAAFIAVSDIKQEIVIAFRGTNNTAQLFLEGLEALVPEEPFNNMGHVVKYFKDTMDKVWPQVQEALQNGINNNYDVIFTGHSLGSALASLAAAQTVARGFRTGAQVKLITFGQPRVGDYTYANNHDNMIPYSYRVVHKADMVPHLPGCSTQNGVCQPHDKKPYHHGTEVWYPDGMVPHAQYKLCTNAPQDEDRSCSNNIGAIHYSISDHLHYFEHMVSQYGKDGCEDTVILVSPLPSTSTVANSFTSMITTSKGTAQSTSTVANSFTSMITTSKGTAQSTSTVANSFTSTITTSKGTASLKAGLLLMLTIFCSVMFLL